MTCAPLASLPPRPRLQQVLDLLRGGSHDFVPVVEEEEDAVGSRGSKGSKGSAGGCSPSDGSRGKAAETKAEQEGGGRTLVGVLYRWQLVSLLRDPALLRMLACQDGTAAAAAAAAQQDAAAGGQAAAAAAAAPQVAAQQAGQAPPQHLDGDQPPACDSAALPMPAPLVERLSREQRLVMIALLAGSPDEEPFESEAAVLAQYDRSSGQGPGGGGGAKGDAGSSSGRDGDCKADVQTHPGDAAAATLDAQQQQQQQQQLERRPPLPLSQRLDLSPLLQCHPVTVSPTISVSHAQLMLRHLGLLGLAARSGPVRLAGVVTRSDVRRVEEAEDGS